MIRARVSIAGNTAGAINGGSVSAKQTIQEIIVKFISFNALPRYVSILLLVMPMNNAVLNFRLCAIIIHNNQPFSGDVIKIILRLKQRAIIRYAIPDHVIHKIFKLVSKSVYLYF